VEIEVKSAEKRSSSGVYLPALDSLRFFAFLAAALSYYLFEFPFLKLKQRFTRIVTRPI
jgi:peptidoglycan/LPS O-acetylase OafA/YrhL